jgi:hypothetical protein
VLLISCTCSDGDCAATAEVTAASVEEAERELCLECQCVVQVVGVSELEHVWAAVGQAGAPVVLAA